MTTSLALRSMLLGMAAATCIISSKVSAVTIKQTAFYNITFEGVDDGVSSGSGVGTYSNEFYKFNSQGIGQLQSVKLSWNLTYEWTTINWPYCDDPINDASNTGCDEDNYSIGSGSGQVLGGEEFYVRSGDGLAFPDFENGPVEITFADGCGWGIGGDLPQCQQGYGISFFYENNPEIKSESFQNVGFQFPGLAPYLGVGTLGDVLDLRLSDEGGYGYGILCCRSAVGDSLISISSGHLFGKVTLLYRFRPLNLPEPSSALMLGLALIGGGIYRLRRRK